MSLIANVIGPQSFEIIRERIALILKSELANQVLLSYDTSIDASVRIENMNPNDKLELTLVNISFASGNYDNKNYGGSKRANPYVYNIDVYANGKADALNSGDYNANVLLQKLIGICASILDNPVYMVLGLANPLVERVYVSEINIANTNKTDAFSTCWGRITFNVVVVETSQPIVPKLLAGYDTTVKLDCTEQGYFYSDSAQ